MVLLFDVDGTVLDTYTLIKNNFIYVLDNFCKSYKYNEEDLRGFYGPTLRESFKKIGCDEEQTNFLIKEYRKISDINYKKYTKIFPNMIEVLKTLKENGHIICALSNKVEEAILLGFKLFDIDQYFDLIVGGWSVKKPKPDPEGINIVKNKFPRNKYVMFGDTNTDVLTANNANIISVGVTWGGTNKNKFINASYIIDNVVDILKLVEDLNV